MPQRMPRKIFLTSPIGDLDGVRVGSSSLETLERFHLDRVGIVLAADCVGGDIARDYPGEPPQPPLIILLLNI